MFCRNLISTRKGEVARIKSPSGYAERNADRGIVWLCPDQVVRTKVALQQIIPWGLDLWPKVLPPGRVHCCGHVAPPSISITRIRHQIFFRFESACQVVDYNSPQIAPHPDLCHSLDETLDGSFSADAEVSHYAGRSEVILELCQCALPRQTNNYGILMFRE